MSKYALRKMIQKFETTGQLGILPGSGRKNILSTCDGNVAIASLKTSVRLQMLVSASEQISKLYTDGDPSIKQKGCAAFLSRWESISGESPISFPEDTSNPYSGFESEPARLQAKCHNQRSRRKMAFLGRSRKEDLRMLATELGLAPSDNLKIIELKDLITNSDRYDEEFVKDVLSVIMEERTATEKQKAAELEEKQKAMVLAQLREREFELEKMKIQLEMQKLSQAPVTSQQLENPKLELNRIIPRFNSKEDEMGLYLTIFEHQVKFLNIPEKTWTAYLIGSLPPDIAQLIAREDEDDAQNYEKVKEMLLKRFRVTGDRFRQYFSQQKKNSDSTWRDLYFELSSYFEGWIKELKITTFDQLKSLIIADQIKRKTPSNIKENFLDIWADLNDPLELAEKLDAYDNLRPGMKNNSNQTFKKKEEFRKPFPIKEKSTCWRIP
ncbi:retrovirus-related Pol polyprotein from transposon 297 [Trichonephila clavipes]|uniref:Retrovirus-related Pol polyprotein from transposon 297 n=1 Tax=Trichonephila clavipes TaxID=2585209 RepID=A0A8X6UTW6_TRICX|nr:retrovirus-related Pol polyprotein from transposon 297 [Trichonephila clavipes]